MDMGGGEEGEGAMYGESNMEIFNTIYKIDNQREFAVWLRELKQELCNRLKGGLQGGDGREVQKEGEIRIPMAASCWGLAENSTIL